MNDRLATLKREADRRGATPPPSPREANWTRAFFDLYGDLPLAERQARSLAYALEREPVCVHPHSRLAGQIYQACPGSGSVDLYGGQDPRWAEYAAVPAAARVVREALPENEAYARYFEDGARPGHIGWDYGRMLRLGISGMIALCHGQGSQTSDPKSSEFYACVEIALQGLRRWVGRHVAALRDAAQAEADLSERQALLEMADICERVPEGPATTFREAVQSFYLQQLAVLFENPFAGDGPGRLDYYLWPYLEADLEAGRSTVGEARELVTELLIKLHERIAPADGWVEAIPVGGRNPDGTLGINPLSYIILETITELDQTHPSVYVRLPDDAPEDFVDLTVDYVLRSGNRAQVYADDPIIAALHGDGVALADARHWTAGGCMEVSPQGCNCDLLFAFAHNVARTLELVINGGCLLQSGERAIPHNRTLADYATFEELCDAFARELERELAILLKRLDFYLDCYAKYRPAFLLSSMTHDCIERGRTINDGGARYSDYGGSGVGIPNVGDSLYAIQRAVFDERRLSGEELLAALRVDFVGHERTRAYLRGLPKFGTDFAPADAMVDRVLQTFVAPLRAHRNRHGGRCHPIILGFTWVVSHGAQVGATADGRRAGAPLAHGLSPQSGSATKGITAAMRSVTHLSLDQVGGGGSTMWDLDATWATPEVVKPLLETFIKRGGHIFQGNVTPVDRLIQAQQDPDSHRDLLVRVGGYSARFTTLSKQTQEEILDRYRYHS